MNKRNTVQRSVILNAVRELGNHAAADEIYGQIAAEHPSISKATVYRNLKALSGDGAIKRVEIPGGADRYDHQCHNHYHMQCIGCGQVFDVDMDFMEALEKRARDSRGFILLSHDIVFKGICPKCNKNKERIVEK